MTGRDPSSESPYEGPGGDALGLTPIADAVSSLLRARGLGETLSLAEVTRAWERAVGAEVAVKVTPVGLRDGELVCEVPDAAWATQMRLLSDSVLSRLAEEVGTPVASRLVTRVRRRSGA